MSTVTGRLTAPPASNRLRSARACFPCKIARSSGKEALFAQPPPSRRNRCSSEAFLKNQIKAKLILRPPEHEQIGSVSQNTLPAPLKATYTNNRFVIIYVMACYPNDEGILSSLKNAGARGDGGSPLPASL